MESQALPHSGLLNSEEELRALPQSSSSELLNDALSRVAGPLNNVKALVKLELSGLSFFIKRAPVLLDINSVMQQGQLIALMGESGSGKTTLLNVLGGRAGYGWTRGDVRINNRPFDPSGMKHLLGYVPQAHLVFKELTVYENLAYASKLRLDRRVTPTTRAQLVEMALELLGLKECRHFVCDPAIGERLSGGELRRVGIGVGKLHCTIHLTPLPHVHTRAPNRVQSNAVTAMNESQSSFATRP